MEPRRVVLTGLGALTPVGNTTEEFWSALKQGKSGIGPITRFDTTGYATRIAGYDVTFRAAIDNLLNRRYWEYQYADYVTPGDPRTLSLNARIDF